MKAALSLSRPQKSTGHHTSLFPWERVGVRGRDTSAWRVDDNSPLTVATLLPLPQGERRRRHGLNFSSPGTGEDVAKRQVRDFERHLQRACPKPLIRSFGPPSPQGRRTSAPSGRLREAESEGANKKRAARGSRSFQPFPRMDCPQFTSKRRPARNWCTCWSLISTRDSTPSMLIAKSVPPR